MIYDHLSLSLLRAGIDESSHSVPRVRAAVVEALMNLDAHFAVDDLIQLFEVERHTWVKAHIARALGALGDASVTSFLRQSLLQIAQTDDISWGLGPALVEALWRLKDTTGVSSYLELPLCAKMNETTLPKKLV